MEGNLLKTLEPCKMAFPPFPLFAVRKVENLLPFGVKLDLKSFVKQHFRSPIAVY